MNYSKYADILIDSLYNDNNDIYNIGKELNKRSGANGLHLVMDLMIIKFTALDYSNDYISKMHMLENEWSEFLH